MKTVTELEKELKEMKEYHLAAYKEYGSELCAGDMIRQEKELQQQIEELKKKDNEL